MTLIDNSFDFRMPNLGSSTKGKHRGFASNRTKVTGLSGMTSYDQLYEQSSTFARKVLEWGNSLGRKAKRHEVQGFPIMGHSIKSTRNRLRKFLAESGLEPDTTLELLQARLNELKKPSGIDVGIIGGGGSGSIALALAGRLSTRNIHIIPPKSND